MKLYMFHGRSSLDEQLEDWGSEGPSLEGVVGFHQTYQTTSRVKFATKQDFDNALTKTGWTAWVDTSDLMLEMQFVGDLLAIKVDGRQILYGDWGFDV